jgi:dsDNA-specific endonuclease/ATPase MutS2
VREIRRNGRLAIEVKNRIVVLEDDAVAPLESPKRTSRNQVPERVAARPVSDSRSAIDVDLHGLTVEEALARMDQALNDAILADAAELRLIHGRSGGRIRVAVHRRLREIPTVGAFRLDPRNAGVTIVTL